MKVYISGPITDRPHRNEAAFRRAAAQIEAAGHEPFVPIDVVPDDVSDWHEAMRHCLSWLPSCDAVAMLDGWEGSDGARVELIVARACGLAEMRVGGRGGLRWA